MYKTHVTQIFREPGKLTFIGNGFKVSMLLNKITQVDINDEATVAAAEQEVAVEKLLTWEPGLAKLLRMQFVVDGVGFSFTVTKKQGTPVAKHFASKLPKGVLGSVHRENSIRAIEYYPLHIHSMTQGLFA